MEKKKTVSYLIDFDSTFVKIEGLDELAEISLNKHPQKAARVTKIKKLTQLGMEGKISFEESLKQRILLLETDKKKIAMAADLLKKRVTASFTSNKAFFRKHKHQIYIISGGFKELILPVVKQFGISSDHVFANTFIYDTKGHVRGIDETNPMSKNQGKIKVVKSLKLSHDLYIIGDGYTDYELKKIGLAKKFIAFTENVIRLPVVQKADEIAHTFDEFLFENNLPRTLSYPKNRIQILLLTPIPKTDREVFQNEGYKILSSEKGVSGKHPLIICTDNSSLYSLRALSKNAKVLAVGLYGEGANSIEQTLQSHGVALFNNKFVAKRIITYVNTGNTIGCLTLPNLNLSRYKNSHRLLHIHKNVSGILAQINQIMAKHKLNILGQYLKTTGTIGYVITEVDAKYEKTVLHDLKKIASTIRLRVLY